MDEPAPNVDNSHANLRGMDALLLALLFLGAMAVHVWQIRHTAVTARDGVGFIRYAWQLQAQPWLGVLRENPHPPGYPLVICAVSVPLRPFLHGTESEIMQVSAQAASAICGALLVVPMFFLGRALFDRRVGFGAALLFQCLPVASRVTGDALTEGTYLLMLACALWLGVEALHRRSPLAFGLCGLFTGLAYLTRPEGVLALAAVGFVLLALQTKGSHRWPIRRVVVCATALCAGALLVAAPYMVAIGHVTNKTTGRNILQTAQVSAPDAPTAPGPACAALPLAVFGPQSKQLDLFRRHLWCLVAIGEEVVKGYHYIAWLPALLGLYWFRRRLSERPGAWVLIVLMVLHILVLWRVAFVEGYVAERHSLTIVLCSSFWALAALVYTAEWISARTESAAWPRRWRLGAPVWTPVVILLVVLPGIPKCLTPLHTNRTGFHAAGAWLAHTAGPDDYIVDPFSWVEYYSGQVAREVQTPPPPRPAHVYVVLGGTKNEHERLPLIPRAKELMEQGHEVFRWPNRPIKFKAEEVVVYQVTPR